MFAGFESRQAWIVDVLQPEYVVKEIVHAIQTNATMVLLPKILNVVLVLQALLPRKASYLLGKWAGIHDCMNNVSFWGQSTEFRGFFFLIFVSELAEKVENRGKLIQIFGLNFSFPSHDSHFLELIAFLF